MAATTVVAGRTGRWSGSNEGQRHVVVAAVERRRMGCSGRQGQGERRTIGDMIIIWQRVAVEVEESPLRPSWSGRRSGDDGRIECNQILWNYGPRSGLKWEAMPPPLDLLKIKDKDKDRTPILGNIRVRG